MIYIFNLDPKTAEQLTWNFLSMEVLRLFETTTNIKISYFFFRSLKKNGFLEKLVLNEILVSMREYNI